MFENIKETLQQFFGKNNELLDSTNIAIEEKLVSPFYGYFITSFVIINWKLFYFALFIDQNIIFQKTGLLKNEFLNNISPQTTLEHLLQFIFYPLIITIFFFWVSPYITRPFFKKNLRNQKELKFIQLELEKKEVKAEKELLSEEVLKKREERRAEKIDPEILWDKEYQTFKRSSYYEKFQDIITSLYTHGGHMSEGNHWESDYFEVDKNILAYADSHNLVELNKNIISLSDKGKFFVKKYIENQGEI